MTETVAPSPLEKTLTRAASLSDYLKVEVGTPTGEGWFTPAAFLEDDAVLDTLWARTAEAFPFKTKSGVLEVPLEGRCELFLKRASCCLSYRLPEYGFCTSCPLQSEAERIGRFQAYLANPDAD